MSVQQEKFKAIADKIREKTGTTEKIKPNDFVNKVEDVYQAGKSSMIDESKIIPKTIVGNPVSATDVSELPHDLSIQLYSDTIEDFSGVEVVQQGANLIPQINEATGNSFGIDWVRNADNSITLNGTSNGGTTINIVDRTTGILFKKGTYTISGNSETTGNVRLWARGINNGTVFGGTYNNTPTTFTLIEDSYIYFYITVNVDTVVDNLTIYPQLNGGSSATPYEPYTEPIIATANASGAVEGLKSISPVTHLYSNADVDIELTYNKSWGMDYEWNKFWDAFQKQDYDENANFNSQRRFHGYWWGWDNFYPKYDIKIKGSGNEGFYTFASNDGRVQSLKSRLEECRVKLDTSEMTACASTFAYSYISELPALDFTGITKASSATFGHCWARLKKIELIKVTKSITYSSWFVNDTGLTYIRFEGDIGNSVDFKYSPLDKASITNIIEHLCTDTDVTGQTLTLKESAVNEAFGIDASDTTTWTEEWINLIKDKSNSYTGKWNISFA